ncbi:hypothetical protein VE00_08674 [Pseudogymnoascus sp. WSF 3629]|nr:hypothetical protein VE00_08674 [Pseudogymnoascus sp. WSF 3629]
MDFEGDAFGVIPRGGRRDLEPLGDHLLPRQNEKPSTQLNTDRHNNDTDSLSRRRTRPHPLPVTTIAAHQVFTTKAYQARVLGNLGLKVPLQTLAINKAAAAPVKAIIWANRARAAAAAVRPAVLVGRAVPSPITASSAQNVGQAVSQNNGQNDGQNDDQNASQNAGENADQNVGQNASPIVSQNADQNASPSEDQHEGLDIHRQVPPHLVEDYLTTRAAQRAAARPQRRRDRLSTLRKATSKKVQEKMMKFPTLGRRPKEPEAEPVGGVQEEHFTPSPSSSSHLKARSSF